MDDVSEVKKALPKVTATRKQPFGVEDEQEKKSHGMKVRAWCASRLLETA